MDIVAQFDPSVVPIPNVNANIPHNGKIVFYNESNIGLKLTFSDGVTDILAPWTAQVYCLGAIPSPQIQFKQAYVLASTGSPVSLVIGIRYMPQEKVHGTFPIALARQSNIGNAITTMSTTNQVNNDGNPIVTTFVEATQQGNTGGSNVAIGNDGSFIFAQWVSSVFTQLFKLAPGATPTLQLGKLLKIQAVDQTGANLANVFGIDFNGNTFLQNHPTNNQTVIYDKNGVALITINSAGAIVTANGTGRLFYTMTPFHLTTNPTVTSGTTTTLDCTTGTGVPVGAEAVLIGGGVSSGTAGAFMTWAPNGATLGQYGGWTCQNAGSQLEEFTSMARIASNGKLDVHANVANIVLQDWYLIGYYI